MVNIKHKKLLISMLFLLFILMIGAVNATSATNTTASHSDLTDTNTPNYDDSEDNININLNTEKEDKISSTKEITTNTLTTEKDTESHPNTKNNNKVVGVNGESTIDENTASTDKTIINNAEDQIKLSANKGKTSKDTEITVNFLNNHTFMFDYGETVIMQVEVKDKDKKKPVTAGNVTFTLNGKTYNQTLDNEGKATQTFENYTLKFNTVTINYGGHDNFNPSNTTHTFGIRVNDINNLYTYYGEPLNVTIYFHNATGTVNISAYYNDSKEIHFTEEHTANIDNGIATIIFSANSYKRAGNSLIVKYSGDDRFAPFEQGPSINVFSKTDPIITSTVYKKKDTNLVLISIPYATGSVNVTVNGVKETWDLVNGTAQKNYIEDITNLTVNYGGNFRLNPYNSSFFVKIGNGENNIVNSTTYSYYFNKQNGGKLYDFIEDDITLDFQGTIDTTQSLEINKRVTIISSTKTAVIKLHSNLNNNDIPNRFIISSGASGSIIKDLNLIDTQTWIYNVNNLYLENITMTFKNIRTGSEMIPVSIRYCNNITLDKCYIFSENTETTLGLFVTSNTTLINSIIVGQGSNVGSLISLECPNEVYDKPYDDYVIRSTNNTIKKLYHSNW